jgi:uncharacterized iron-regulated protein
MRRWQVRGAAAAALISCAGLVAAATPALEAFIESAREADIVVLGETHGNPEHHRNQAAVVAALSPAALVFEMIPQAREAALNELRDAGAERAALAEALDWETSGWPDFDLYAAIMEAAPEARVFGAGQPREDVERAMREGAADAFGPDAAIYGLDRPLPPEEQALRERIQAEAHCGAPAPEALAAMVEAQRFRDAGLADATLWARIMTGGGQVVVIAGSGHADKARGMPALIAEAEPEATVVALGQFEGGGGAAPAEDFDAVLRAPAPDRGDPCATLTQPPE